MEAKGLDPDYSSTGAEAMAEHIVHLLQRVDNFGIATFAPDKGAQAASTIESKSS